MFNYLTYFTLFRRLFPIVLVTIRGLNLSLKYNISARFVSADSYRYKYICGRWISVGESDVIQDESRMIYAHPTSPNTGEYWMKKPITFKSIKITHHLKSKNGNVSLQPFALPFLVIVLSQYFIQYC